MRDKEKVKAYNKKYKEENKEKLREANKKYVAENKEKRKEWVDGNKEKINEYSKKYHQEHKEKINEYSKKYVAENKEKMKGYENKYKGNKYRLKRNKAKKEYYRMRRENDPVYRFQTRVRSVLSGAFIRGGYKKNSRTHELLCADYSTVWSHLEATWLANYGKPLQESDKYHIDHVIPCSSAKTIDFLVELQHYQNLQLLTPEDNMNKGAQIDWRINARC